MTISPHDFLPGEYVRIERDPSMPAGGGRATFIVAGELDLGNVDRLIRAVAPDAVHGAHLLLDLSGLEFMDCSGIRALIEILSSVAPGGRLTIREPSRQVRRVLEVAAADLLEGLVIVSS